MHEKVFRRCTSDSFLEFHMLFWTEAASLKSAKLSHKPHEKKFPLGDPPPPATLWARDTAEQFPVGLNISSSLLESTSADVQKGAGGRERMGDEAQTFSALKKDACCHVWKGLWEMAGRTLIASRLFCPSPLASSHWQVWLSVPAAFLSPAPTNCGPYIHTHRSNLTQYCIIGSSRERGETGIECELPLIPTAGRSSKTEAEVTGRELALWPSTQWQVCRQNDNLIFQCCQS